MHQSRIALGGGVVFWSAPEYVHMDLFQQILASFGHADLAPEGRPPVACLEDALREVLGGPKTLIRRLEKKDGFGVATEMRGADENFYATTLSVRVDEETTPPTLRYRPWDERADRITAAYNIYRSWFRGTQVTSSLVALMARLQGVSLRPKGAIYWLPGNRLGAWRDVTAAIEGTVARGFFRPYLIEHEMNAEAMRAVRDGIVAEVKEVSARMYQEIMNVDDPLGERALRNRKEECESLIEKVGIYEGLLDTGLMELRSMLEVTKEAAAAAALLEAAKA